MARNSRAVAQEHYLQVTDAHFAEAAQEQPKLPAVNDTAQAAQKERRSPPKLPESSRNRTCAQMKIARFFRAIRCLSAMFKTC